MPASRKVTTEAVLQAAEEVLREKGFSAVNARNVAEKLGCSTQPIYLCFENMDQLRQGIGIQAYGQRDPKVEYKLLGYDMFDAMTKGISEDTVRTLFRVRLEQKVEREQVAKVTGTNKDDSAARAPKKRTEKKVYPNDPCPCGSGKKYKQCCGRKA